MRDRLVELLLADVGCEKDGRGDCSMCEYKYSEDGCIKHLATLLADHLLANGVIVPPCKVGDTVYVLFGEPSHTIKEFRVRTIVFGETHDSIGFTNKSLFTIWDKRWYDYFGKTVFLTREEAEQALKGEHHAEIH